MHDLQEPPDGVSRFFVHLFVAIGTWIAYLFIPGCVMVALFPIGQILAVVLGTAAMAIGLGAIILFQQSPAGKRWMDRWVDDDSIAPSWIAFVLVSFALLIVVSQLH